MKKLLIVLSLVMSLSLFAASNQGGGLFHRGSVPDEEQTNVQAFPHMSEYGSSNDREAPVGSGIVVLSVLGGAYLIGKTSKSKTKDF